MYVCILRLLYISYPPIDKPYTIHGNTRWHNIKNEKHFVLHVYIV